MKTEIIKRLISFSFVFAVLLISCDTNKEIKDYKKQNTNEIKAIEEERIKHQQDIDSLSKEIDSLSETKSEIKERTDFAESEIYRIIKVAQFDHLIIGTKNLDDSKTLFEEKLGFKIKNGNHHKNGISHFFVEFSDESEIEIMSIENPADKLANDYYQLLKNNKYGLQFALRTNEISNLRKHLNALKFDYEVFAENKIYSTLSKRNLDNELPLFFIQFNNENNNTRTNHLNKSSSIKSVWFSTSNIKKTARQLVDFGLDAVGNYDLPTFKNKVIQFMNNNFEIILIESDKYEITGMTITVEDINIVKKIIKTNFIEQNDNIYIKPSQTKLIWIEFVEY
jgi:hypothetical protein